MHCTNCGSYVVPGTKFCAGCGQPTSDPEATKIARPGGPVSLETQGNTAVEQVIFRIRPTLLFVKAGYAAAAIAAILLVAILAIVTFINIPWYVALVLGMALLLIPAYYHIRRNSILYILTDSKLEIDRGFISRTTRNIPLRNIQDVTVQAGLFQRLVGYGDLIVDNASEFGGTTVLENIEDPRGHADLLLQQLRRWH